MSSEAPAVGAPAPSARRQQLLERAYGYVQERGLADVSLRPLAAAIGSSPRVLLFLFGSKEGLVRALLARARADELAALERVRRAAGAGGLRAVGEATWAWLATPAHRPLLQLWLEGYARSLVEPAGPWAEFGAHTVRDWLTVLEEAGGGEEVERTLLLAVMRGALLDLLATGDLERVSAAVRRHLDALGPGRATSD